MAVCPVHGTVLLPERALCNSYAPANSLGCQWEGAPTYVLVHSLIQIILFSFLSAALCSYSSLLLLPARSVCVACMYPPFLLSPPPWWQPQCCPPAPSSLGRAVMTTALANSHVCFAGALICFLLLKPKPPKSIFQGNAHFSLQF